VIHLTLITNGIDEQAASYLGIAIRLNQVNWFIQFSYFLSRFFFSDFTILKSWSE